MHIPVLKEEVLKYLEPKDKENFIDCTVGQGGHAKAILEKTQGRVLGIDLDKEQIENCRKEITERIVLVNDNYKNLKEIVQRENFHPVNGILFDLGYSTWHIESDRGFTFQEDQALSMSYEGSLKAEQIVNNYSQEELERVLKEFGQERFYRLIAKEIVKSRPIKTTFQLVEAIRRAVPRTRERIHFATRTFQALRIEANQELDNLEKALPQAEEVLAKGGKLVVISFHSLEDRIVKNFLKQSKLKILTKKPITPSLEELKANIKARSAKLRAAEKI